MKLTVMIFTLLFAKPALILALSQYSSSKHIVHEDSRAQNLEKYIAKLFARHETLTEIHLTVGRAGVYPIAGIDSELDALKDLYRQAVDCLEAMENFQHERWSELEKKFLSLDQVIARAQKKLVENLGQNSTLVSLYRT